MVKCAQSWIFLHSNVGPMRSNVVQRLWHGRSLLYWYAVAWEISPLLICCCMGDLSFTDILWHGRSLLYWYAVAWEISPLLIYCGMEDLSFTDILWHGRSLLYWYAVAGALRLSAFSILGVLRLSANFSYIWAHFTCGLPGEFNI